MNSIVIKWFSKCGTIWNESLRSDGSFKISFQSKTRKKIRVNMKLVDCLIERWEKLKDNWLLWDSFHSQVQLRRPVTVVSIMSNTRLCWSSSQKRSQLFSYYLFSTSFDQVPHFWKHLSFLLCLSAVDGFCRIPRVGSALFFWYLVLNYILYSSNRLIAQKL